MKNKGRTVINEYEINNQFVYITITAKNKEGVYKFNVSHYDEINQYIWTINPEGYARSHYKEKIIYLHRLITKCSSDMVVDHLSRDITDNMDENLRVCTKSENGMNRGIQINNKSGVAGVYYGAREKKWIANIKLNGKTKRQIGRAHV